MKEKFLDEIFSPNLHFLLISIFRGESLLNLFLDKLYANPSLQDIAKLKCSSLIISISNECPVI